MKARYLGLLLICLILTALVHTQPVKAATNTVGPFRVTGGTLGEDYAYTGGVLTVMTSTPLDIANVNPATPTSDRIVVPTGITAYITLSGVNINATTSNSPLTIEGTASVNLTLAEGTTNTLIGSGSDMTGLAVTESARLTINGKGSLSATGNGCGSGIGGNGGSKNGNITIDDGNIIAIGEVRDNSGAKLDPAIEFTLPNYTNSYKNIAISLPDSGIYSFCWHCIQYSFTNKQGAVAKLIDLICSLLGRQVK